MATPRRPDGGVATAARQNPSPRTRATRGEPPARQRRSAKKIGYHRKVSLHVGVSAYTAWNSLNNATRDAKKLAERFRGVLKFDETRLVLDADATKDGIRNAIQELTACDEDDLIVVTFSGHGAPLQMANGDDQGYLVPVDAPTPIALANVFDFISMAELSTWADECLRARHVVFLLDCCFSGLMSSRGLSDGQKKRVDAHLQMKCRYVINAGTKDEEVSDGRGSHSPFVTALLQSSAGTGNDQECDIEALKKEIEVRVANMPGVRQTPTGGTLKGDEGGCAFLALPSLAGGGGILLPAEEAADVAEGASRGRAGSDVPTRQASMSLHRALQAEGLENFTDALADMGIASADDLAEMKEEDMDEVGMSRFQRRKMRRIISGGATAEAKSDPAPKPEPAPALTSHAARWFMEELQFKTDLTQALGAAGATTVLDLASLEPDALDGVMSKARRGEQVRWRKHRAQKLETLRRHRDEVYLGPAATVEAWFDAAPGAPAPLVAFARDEELFTCGLADFLEFAADAVAHARTQGGEHAGRASERAVQHMRKALEAREKAAREKKEREAREKAAREKKEREAREKKEREARERAAREKKEREARERAEREKKSMGAKVVAKYGGSWYKGTVRAVHADYTFDIAYDDGDTRSNVPAHEVLTPAQDEARKAAEPATAVQALKAAAGDADKCAAACEKICDLALNNAANKDAIRAAGGIPALVAALTTHKNSASVCEQACRAMINLTDDNAANRDAVREARGIPAVVAALTTHKDSAGVCKWACFALRNLAMTRDQCTFIGSAGAIPPIVAALTAHKANASVCEQACAALHNLALSAANKPLIRAERAHIEYVVAHHTGEAKKWAQNALNKL